jgi:hypothetical protein
MVDNLQRTAAEEATHSRARERGEAAHLKFTRGTRACVALDRQPAKISADAGFASEENLNAMAPIVKEMDAYQS